MTHEQIISIANELETLCAKSGAAGFDADAHGYATVAHNVRSIPPYLNPRGELEEIAAYYAHTTAASVARNCTPATWVPAFHDAALVIRSELKKLA